MKKNEIRRAVVSAREAFAATRQAFGCAGCGRAVDFLPAIVGMDVMAEYVTGLFEGEFPVEPDPDRLVRKLTGAWLNQMEDRGQFGAWEEDGDE